MRDDRRLYPCHVRDWWEWRVFTEKRRKYKAKRVKNMEQLINSKGEDDVGASALVMTLLPLYTKAGLAIHDVLQ